MVRKVKRRGRWVWRARVMVDGKLKSRHFAHKDEAMFAEAELRAGSKTKEESTPTKEKTKPTPSKDKDTKTLDELWPRVVAHCMSGAHKRPWRPTTRKSRESIYRVRISPEIGRLRPDEIDQETIDTMMVRLATGEVTGKRMEPSTVGITMELVSVILHVAQRWRLVHEMPAVPTAIPRSRRIADDEWLTQEEVTRLADRLAPEWRRLFTVAVRSGLRVSELGALRFRDVRLAEKLISVERGWCPQVDAFQDPKSGKARETPITWDAVAALKELGQRRPNDLVFGGLGRRDKDKSKPFVGSTYQRRLEEAAAAAGIDKPITPHSTRHSWASHATAGGVPTRVLMLFGGWANESMLDVYAHLRPRDVQHWMDVIAPPRMRVVQPDQG